MKFLLFILFLLKGPLLFSSGEAFASGCSLLGDPLSSRQRIHLIETEVAIQFQTSFYARGILRQLSYKYGQRFRMRDASVIYVYLMQKERHETASLRSSVPLVWVQYRGKIYDVSLGQYVDRELASNRLSFTWMEEFSLHRERAPQNALMKEFQEQTPGEVILAHSSEIRGAFVREVPARKFEAFFAIEGFLEALLAPLRPRIRSIRVIGWPVFFLTRKFKPTERILDWKLRMNQRVRED